MTKQTFKIFIAGVEYSTYISYPVSITEKNLDESLNLATVSLKHTTDASPFKPNRRVELIVYADGILAKRYSFLLLNDIVERVGVTSYYNHKLSLIEFTQFLDNIVLPDLAITRIKGVYEPTLLDVVDKIMDEVHRLTGNTYGRAGATETILDAIPSPEWTFTRMTALEALRMVFSMAKIVPTMISFTVLGHVGLLDTSETTKMVPFATQTEAYDPQTYKTALYSNVENFIAGPETITEPANGWLTPRSPDGFEISGDNLMITTTRPIYKIEKFEIRRWIRIQCQHGLFVIPESVVPQDAYKEDFFDDIIYEEGVYNTLENLSAYGKKGGAFYYTQGKPNIVGLTYRAPTKWSWNPSKQAWRVICEEYEGVGAYYETTVAKWIKPEYVELVEEAIAAYIPSSYYHYWLWFREDDIATGVTDPFKLQFRITYTPYISTNIFTYRERYDSADEVQSYQTYNQTANVIDRNVLADLHDKVIKRGSGSGLDYTFLHKNAADLPTIGARFGDYVITSADYTFNQYGIQSTYNVDKYYQKLQKYVAVLEKWRQFSIPNESIVKRQITFNEFIKFAAAPAANTSHLDPAYYNDAVTSNIQLASVSLEEQTTHTATSFAFNNSMIFEFSMPGNATAGSISDTLDSDKRKDKPVIYSDENGMAQYLYSLELTTGYFAFNLSSSYNLPTYTNTNLPIWSLDDITEINKDAREQLSFSVQLHHIDTTGKFYINSGWVNRNGLIGGVGINTGGHLAFLDFKPFNTTDATGHIMNSGSVIHAYNSANGGHIIIPTRTNSSGTAAQSWAMIDGTTNEILYWCDETVAPGATNTQYVINFSDTY